MKKHQVCDTQLNCLKKRQLRAKIYVHQLCQYYPPEKMYLGMHPSTPGDNSSTYRYCTYSSSGGDTVPEQLLLYNSSSMLKGACAERWTPTPVRT